MLTKLVHLIHKPKTISAIIKHDVGPRSAYKSDFSYVCAVRRWAFKKVPLSSPGLLLDRNSYEIYNAPAEEQLRMFNRFVGGYLCGGTANFLRLVYLALGFEAHSIDFGNTIGGTHVITLVKIKERDQKIWTYQDAFFNCTFLNTNKTPMDLKEAITLLQAKKDSDIIIQNCPNKTKIFIFKNKSELFEYMKLRSAYQNIPSTWYEYSIAKNGNIYRHQEHMYFNTLDEHPDFKHRYGNWLEKKGHKNKAIYIFLYPISASTESLLHSSPTGKTLELL